MGCLNIRVLVFIVYMVIAIEASHYDIKHRLVRNKTYISLIFLAIFQEFALLIANRKLNGTNYIEYFVVISAITFLLLIFAALTDAIGGGDIKYMFCNMLLFPKNNGAERISSWFLIMFILLFFYVLLYKRRESKEKGIAMLPFISLASITIFILNLRS